MSAHGRTGHGHACCRHSPVGARPGAVAARCGGPVICGSCGSDAARIHASGTQGEQGAGLLARVAELEAELEHWRSGRRVKGLPRIESVPDGIQYAARLARAIGTEGGEDHDALLAEAAQRMKGLHDAASHLLQETVVLRREARGICGDHMPPLLVGGVPVGFVVVCDLPRDHEGDWHGCEEEGARWTQVDPLTSADIEALASRLAAAPDIGWEGCCRAAYESEGNVHDHPVTAWLRERAEREGS